MQGEQATYETGIPADWWRSLLHSTLGPGRRSSGLVRHLRGKAQRRRPPKAASSKWQSCFQVQTERRRQDSEEKRDWEGERHRLYHLLDRGPCGIIPPASPRRHPISEESDLGTATSVCEDPTVAPSCERTMRPRRLLPGAALLGRPLDSMRQCVPAGLKVVSGEKRWRCGDKRIVRSESYSMAVALGLALVRWIRRFMSPPGRRQCLGCGCDVGRSVAVTVRKRCMEHRWDQSACGSWERDADRDLDRGSRSVRRGTMRVA